MHIIIIIIITVQHIRMYKDKGIPITGHEGPRGCGCKGTHIQSHSTRKG